SDCEHTDCDDGDTSDEPKGSAEETINPTQSRLLHCPSRQASYHSRKDENGKEYRQERRNFSVLSRVYVRAKHAGEAVISPKRAQVSKNHSGQREDLEEKTLSRGQQYRKKNHANDAPVKERHSTSSLPES